MAKQKNHIPGFVDKISEYADKRLLDMHQYSPYHLRLMDGGYVVLDVWTTGRYYLVMTDYESLFDGGIEEREGEKGFLPIEKLWPFLDTIFFGDDMSKHAEIEKNKE